MLGLFLAMTLLSAMQPQPVASTRPIDSGVSQALARERASAIRDLHYDLTFSIPGARNEPVQGRAVVSLALRAPARLVFDFAQPRESVRRVAIDGSDARADFVNGHIVIPASSTRAGVNRIEIEFVAGDAALNRNDEFLYTLFVPARARLTFPCFDQPDLKARYRLKLSVPEGWQAVANGASKSADGALPSGSPGQIEFEETPPLPPRCRSSYKQRPAIVRRDRTILSKIAEPHQSRFASFQACEPRNFRFARVKPFSRCLPEYTGA